MSFYLPKNLPKVIKITTTIQQNLYRELISNPTVLLKCNKYPNLIIRVKYNQNLSNNINQKELVYLIKINHSLSNQYHHTIITYQHHKLKETHSHQDSHQLNFNANHPEMILNKESKKIKYSPKS